MLIHQLAEAEKKIGQVELEKAALVDKILARRQEVKAGDKPSSR